jgi:hypothetical protein
MGDPPTTAMDNVARVDNGSGRASTAGGGGTTGSKGVIRGVVVGDAAIATALAAKENSAALWKDRREERLRRKTEAAERKKLQAARIIENSNKKRSRERDTIQKYFTTSRKFDVVSGSDDTQTAPHLTTDYDQPTLVATALNSTSASLHVSCSLASVDTLSRVESIDGTSSDVEILVVSAAPITVSTDSSAACLPEDDPDWHEFHNVPVGGFPEDKSEEEEFPDLPPIPKRRRDSRSNGQLLVPGVK